MPLPCAHPNCHSLTYAFRSEGQVVPLPRFIDARNHLDILANGITFTRASARELIDQYLGEARRLRRRAAAPTSMRVGDGAPSGLPPTDDATRAAADEFFRGRSPRSFPRRDVFRITITSFLDAYNFDVRRLMKCCIHHVLPSGHVIPFCAYNVLYRDGHVPLPPLRAPVALPPAP